VNAAAAPPFDGWDDAVRFALEHHGTGTRKGTRVPFVTHPFAVAATLAYHYPEHDALVVAGLLHDVVEDTDATLGEVERGFGEDVAALVRRVSKDDEAMFRGLGTSRGELTRGRDPAEADAVLWRARREFLLAQLRDPEAPPDALRLEAADALDNLATIARDLRNPLVGERVWERFKVGRTESVWFYATVTALVRDGLPGEPLGDELARALREVEADGAVEPPPARH
jgi:(p)ppGpp synthase/HD superfamily hydrolase